VLLADEAALREIDEAVQLAERSSDDYALGLSRLTLGAAPLQQDSPAERQRGLQALAQVRDMCLHERFYLTCPSYPWSRCGSHVRRPAAETPMARCH
jgi:adenylate cyclase